MLPTIKRRCAVVFHQLVKLQLEWADLSVAQAWSLELQ